MLVNANSSSIRVLMEMRMNMCYDVFGTRTQTICALGGMNTCKDASELLIQQMFLLPELSFMECVEFFLGFLRLWGL